MTDALATLEGTTVIRSLRVGQFQVVGHPASRCNDQSDKFGHLCKCDDVREASRKKETIVRIAC